MKIVGPSGDVALDRAAYGGITTSNPFPPLPSEFSGPYLELRFHFFYNPDRSDLAANPTSQSSSKSGVTVSLFPHESVDVPVGGSEKVILIPSVTGSTDRAVTWSIRGKGCSGDTCGTIEDGLYTAPTLMPDPPAVTVTAYSHADPTASASVEVHLVAPQPKP